MHKSKRVTLLRIKLPIIKPGQHLGGVLVRSLHARDIALRDGDIVCIASKVVSIAERQIVTLDEIDVTHKARILAKRYGMNTKLAQIVLEEADEIMGGVTGFLLTIKNNILTANAGVDVKNSPPGTATLWPNKPDHSAAALRNILRQENHTKIGVLIVDSRITPLRLGTTGLAIGLAGVNPIKDERGKYDLYGRRVRFTQMNVADDLAASAHLLMNERMERTALIVIRGAPISLNKSASRETTLAPNKCLFFSTMRFHKRKLL